MRRLIVMGAILGAVAGVAGLPGCEESSPGPIGAGGRIQGERAAKRIVARLFNLIRLEERDRAFGMLVDAYGPVLKSLQDLDGPRKRLIGALGGSAHTDLAEMLRQKRLTSAPELIDIVVGPPKHVALASEGRTAAVKVEVPLPDGERKQLWARLTREEVRWRVMIPLCDSKDGKGSGPSPEQTRVAVDKAVAKMKQVMDDLAGRLEAGEMIEDAVIREKLTAAGRPLAATLQRMIYGQTTIK